MTEKGIFCRQPHLILHDACTVVFRGEPPLNLQDCSFAGTCPPFL